MKNERTLACSIVEPWKIFRGKVMEEKEGNSRQIPTMAFNETKRSKPKGIRKSLSTGFESYLHNTGDGKSYIKIKKDIEKDR